MSTIDSDISQKNQIIIWLLKRWKEDMLNKGYFPAKSDN